MRRYALPLLFAISLGLHVLDVATTLVALRAGIADEGNPLNVLLLRLGGPALYVVDSTLLFVAGLAVLAALARRWRRDPDAFLRAAPLVGFVAYVGLAALVVAGNLLTLGYFG